MPRLSVEDRARRRLGIGSSDVPQILGISPFRDSGPMAVFVEKLGIDEGPGDDDDDDFVADEKELGHELEWPLIQYYARKNKLTVTRGGTIQHPTIPWAFANVDGVSQDEIGRIMVEGKCVGLAFMRHWDPRADDGVPDYVRAQVAWQMACADVQRAHIVAMIGGPSGFHVFELLRDLELEAMIIERCSDFWHGIQSGERIPEIDNTDAARTYLAHKYPPRAERVEEHAPDDLFPVGERRIAAAHAEELAKAEKRACDALFMEEMGKAGVSKLKGPTWSFSWALGKNDKRYTRFTDHDKASRVRVPVSAIRAEENNEL